MLGELISMDQNGVLGTFEDLHCSVKACAISVQDK